MIAIVVPMAGNGARFVAERYDVPKPLIEVEPGRRMIDYVIASLSDIGPHHFYFVCRSAHVEAYDLKHHFAARTEAFTIVEAPGPTRGPASSALLAAPHLDGDGDLLIAYSDGFLAIDMRRFIERCRASGADGVIPTYPSVNPAYSYARIDPSGRILETAEKRRISPSALAGQYYFRRGRDFIAAARRMIALERTAAGEFFVAPVYNELIADGATVLAHPIPPAADIDLGTPADLERFRAGSALRAAAV
jgi:NDP-sugar pyrophosphorylase family protein